MHRCVAGTGEQGEGVRTCLTCRFLPLIEIYKPQNHFWLSKYFYITHSLWIWKQSFNIEVKFLEVINSNSLWDTWGFPGGSAVKNLLAVQESQEVQVWSLGQEDPLEEGMSTHSSILAWRLPWTEEPVGYIAYGVAKSQTQLKWLSTQHSTHKPTYSSIQNYLYIFRFVPLGGKCKKKKKWIPLNIYDPSCLKLNKPWIMLSRSLILGEIIYIMYNIYYKIYTMCSIYYICIIMI